MRRNRIRLGATVLAAALAVAVIGAATASGASTIHVTKARKPAAAATTTKRVKIVDFAFSPRSVTISKGTRVKWVNTGAVPHTSTSNTGKWDSGVIDPGDSYGRVFRKAGTFRYHCTVHPAMTARIIVQ